MFFVSGIAMMSQQTAQMEVAQVTVPLAPIPVVEVIQKKVEVKPIEATPVEGKLRPELIPICSCESTGHPDRVPRHYEDDGVTVRRGRINPNDIGMCQINIQENNNGPQIRKMGLDVFKKEDNIKYANWLYDKYGTKPWNWSKHCWGTDK